MGRYFQQQITAVTSSHPSTAGVVGAPQKTSQPVSSIFFFFCSPLPSGTWRTPGLSISWCFLPTCFSVCLVFFPLSLRLARWFWPDLMNGRHDHTTAVYFSLRWSGGLRMVRLPAGSWNSALSQPRFRFYLLIPGVKSPIPLPKGLILRKFCVRCFM